MSKLATKPNEPLSTIPQQVYNYFNIQDHHKYVDVATVIASQSLVRFYRSCIKKPLFLKVGNARQITSGNTSDDSDDSTTSPQPSAKILKPLPGQPPLPLDPPPVRPPLPHDPPPPTSGFPPGIPCPTTPQMMVVAPSLDSYTKECRDFGSITVKLQEAEWPAFVFPSGMFIRLYETNNESRMAVFGRCRKIPMVLFHALLHMSTEYKYVDHKVMTPVTTIDLDDAELHECVDHPPCLALQVLLAHVGDQKKLINSDVCPYYNCRISEGERPKLKHLEVCRLQARLENHKSYDNTTICPFERSHHIPIHMLALHINFCPSNPKLKAQDIENSKVCAHHLAASRNLANSNDIWKKVQLHNSRAFEKFLPKDPLCYLISKYGIHLDDVALVRDSFNFTPELQARWSKHTREYWVRAPLIPLLNKLKRQFQEQSQRQ